MAQMEELILKLKKFKRIYLIKNDFKIFITEKCYKDRSSFLEIVSEISNNKNINNNSIETNPSFQEQKSNKITVYELKEDILERLNYKLFERSVVYNKIFSIYRQIYYDKNKDLNGINNNQIQMRQSIQLLDKTQNNTDEDDDDNNNIIEQMSMNSDELIQRLCDQLTMNDIRFNNNEEQEEEYKCIELISPFFIQDKFFNNIYKINITLINSYYKILIPCYDCIDQQNQINQTVDLNIYNQQLLQINNNNNNNNNIMVIKELKIDISYEITCECCPDVFPNEQNQSYYDSIIQYYSNIKYEEITLSGNLPSSDTKFEIIIEIDSYLSKLNISSHLLPFIQFKTERNSYILNQLQIYSQYNLNLPWNIQSFDGDSNQSQKQFISEIVIITRDNYVRGINQYKDLLNYNYLLRISAIEYSKHYKLQEVEIVNQKYSHFIHIIAGYKLFYGLFSMFRINYDLIDD